MPLLHFHPPLQAQNYLYNLFLLLNEILHKLTSCHFTLRNKNVERFMPKNTSLFHFSEQNCTIHQRTITQTHDLSRHYFSLKTRFLLQNSFFSLYRNFHYSSSKTFFSSPKKKLSNFIFKILLLKKTK